MLMDIKLSEFKKSINDIAARAILYDMATSGKFDTRYVRYVN